MMDTTLLLAAMGLMCIFVLLVVGMGCTGRSYNGNMNAVLKKLDYIEDQIDSYLKALSAIEDSLKEPDNRQKETGER